MASDLPARISGIDDRRRHHGRQPRGGRLRASTDGDPLPATPPPWRPDLTDPYDLVEEVVRIVGYDQVPVGAAARGRRPRADPRAAAAPPDRPHPGRRRLRRGDQLPVRRRRPPSTSSACPPTTRCAARSGWPTRSRPRSRRTPRRCCPACSRPPPATSAAAPRASRCSRPARSRSRSTAARRRSTASTGGPATTSSPSCSRRSPSSRCTWPWCWPASASAPAGGAPVATAGWSDAIELVRRLGDELGVEVEVTLGQPDAVAPGPLRPGPASTASSSATPASCTPRCARRSGCRPASAAVEIDLDFLMRARGRRGARAGVLDVPRRQGGRRPGGGRRRDRRRGRGGAARGRRRATSSRSGSSTSTPATRSGPATSRWPSRCGSGRRTAP